MRGFDRQHAAVKYSNAAVSLDRAAGAASPLLAARFDRDGAIVDRVSA